MNIWKSTKVYTAFLFYGPRILEGEHWRKSKIIGINRLNCCVKVTTADLHKISQKMREWRSEYWLAAKFPSKGGVMSRSPLLPCPHRNVHLWCIFFALLAMIGPLPTELKLRENTEYTTNRLFFIGERKGRQMRRKGNKNKQDGWGTKHFILYLLVFALA